MTHVPGSRGDPTPNRPASAAIDVALSELVRRHRVLRDVEAYTKTRRTVEEEAFSVAVPDWGDLVDDTDWDAQWPEDS